MIIKTAPSDYFFSGEINLNPNEEQNINLESLTQVQLLDVMEGIQTGALVQGDKDKINKQLIVLLGGEKSSSGSSGSGIEENQNDGVVTSTTTVQTSMNYVTEEEFLQIKDNQEISDNYAITDSYIPILEGTKSWPN